MESMLLLKADFVDCYSKLSAYPEGKDLLLSALTHCHLGMSFLC